MEMDSQSHPLNVFLPSNTNDALQSSNDRNAQSKMEETPRLKQEVERLANQQTKEATSMQSVKRHRQLWNAVIELEKNIKEQHAQNEKDKQAPQELLQKCNLKALMLCNMVINCTKNHDIAKHKNRLSAQEANLHHKQKIFNEEESKLKQCLDAFEMDKNKAHKH